MNIVLIQPSLGLARDVGRLLAERGEVFFLVGEDAAALDLSARDLEIRSGRRARFGSHASKSRRFEDLLSGLDAAFEELKDVEVVLLPIFGARETARATAQEGALWAQAAIEWLAGQRRGALIVVDDLEDPREIPAAERASLLRFLEELSLKHHDDGVLVATLTGAAAARASTEEGVPGANESARRVLNALDRLMGRRRGTRDRVTDALRDLVSYALRPRASKL